MRHRFETYPFYLFFILILVACGSRDDQSVSIWGNTDHLGSGVLSKYHTIYDHDDITRRDISYEWIRLDQDTLHECDMLINLDTLYYIKYVLEGESWEVVDFYARWAAPESEITVFQKEPFSWSDPKGACSITIQEPDDGRLISYHIKQLSARDTILDNKPGKILGIETKILVNGEEASMSTSEKTYIYGRGRCFQNLLYNGKPSQQELIAQYSHDKYEELQSEYDQLQRVAYIEDLDSLELCFSKSRINDYYNGDKAQYIGGQQPLWQMLDNGHASKQYPHESGYLTYRFVINCKGEAAGFIVEAADLDYQAKEFHPELVQHFLQKLKAVDTWQPLRINGQTRDAYTYVTIKLENGKIIEILP